LDELGVEAGTVTDRVADLVIDPIERPTEN